MQARGVSLYGASTSAIRTLGQTPARCPRTALEVGWWLRGFRRASSTVLVQRVCVCVCVCGCVWVGGSGAGHARQPKPAGAKAPHTAAIPLTP